jgi:hypothetical protein
MKKPARKPLPDPLKLSTTDDEIVVWLKRTGGRPRRIGSVNRRLATDASRHGQDLVGDLVDTALLAADRRLPPRS